MDIKIFAIAIMRKLDDDIILPQEVYGAVLDAMPLGTKKEIYNITYDVIQELFVHKMIVVGQYGKNRKLLTMVPLPIVDDDIAGWVNDQKNLNSPPPNFDAAFIFELTDAARQIRETKYM